MDEDLCRRAFKTRKKRNSPPFDDALLLQWTDLNTRKELQHSMAIYLMMCRVDDSTMQGRIQEFF